MIKRVAPSTVLWGGDSKKQEEGHFMSKQIAFHVVITNWDIRRSLGFRKKMQIHHGRCD